MSKIEESKASLETLAFKEFSHVDYHDSFLVQSDSAYDDVDAFAKVYFLKQPSWLSAISMNMFSKANIQKALEASELKKGTHIGAWKIYTRDDKEIVFGDDMGFMEYRFSFVFIDNHHLQTSTVVQYKGRFGAFYFSLVKLMHKRFVKMSLQVL